MPVALCFCFGLFALIPWLYLAAEFPSCGGRQVFVGPPEPSQGLWHHVLNSSGLRHLPWPTQEQWRVRGRWGGLGSWQGCLSRCLPLWSLTAPVECRSKGRCVVVWSCQLPLSSLSANRLQQRADGRKSRALPLSFSPPSHRPQTTNCVYTSVTEFSRDARHARYERIREVITQ